MDNNLLPFKRFSFLFLLKCTANIDIIPQYTKKMFFYTYVF
jgi:hypothetical protein